LRFFKKDLDSLINPVRLKKQGDRMLRTAFIIALAIGFVAGLPLAMAASVGGSQESVQDIVEENFAPIDVKDFLRR
jgi:hypothetical protein